MDRPNEDAHSNVRFALTVLTLMRGVRVPPILDTGPITSPPTGSVGKEWVGYLSGFWAALRSVTKRVDAPVGWKAYHFTNKRGPGGGQAILGWLRDLLSCPASLISSLRVLGGPALCAVLDYLLLNQSELITLFGDPGLGPIRRVVAIQDAEGKSRVIAMIDYFSQTALKPLHRYLFRLLAAIPQDVTFDQGSFVDKVKDWPKGIRYSVDLSKATDRFPIDLICLVLSGHFPTEYVSAWKDVMVGYAFSSDSGDVTYRVGNPMGAYSSWASFALSHHFVMYRIARELGLPWETLQYVVLGDDILIGDPRVGRRYMALVSELGVEVSSTKTYISSELSEFAKRYHFRGSEVSPFPISSVSETREVPDLVSSLLGSRSKGLIPASGVPDAVKGLLWETGSTQSESRAAGIQAFYCQKATAFLRGEITAGDFVTVICSRPGFEVLSGPDSVSQKVSPVWGMFVLRRAMVDLLKESLVAGPGSFATVYDRTEESVLRNPDRSLRWEELENSVPVLGLSIQIDKIVLELDSTLENLPWDRED